jgi:hypothetical protein
MIILKEKLPHYESADKVQSGLSSAGIMGILANNNGRLVTYQMIFGRTGSCQGEASLKPILKLQASRTGFMIGGKQGLVIESNDIKSGNAHINEAGFLMAVGLHIIGGVDLVIRFST